MAKPGDHQRIPSTNPLAHATLTLVAHHIPVALHQHFAVQVVMSLRQPFMTTIAGEHHPNIYGFVIDSNIAHACQPGDASVLIVSIDASTDTGKAVRERLGGQPFVLLEDLIEIETIHEFQRAYWKAMHDAQACYDPLVLVTRLRLGVPSAPPMDARIVAAMTFIHEHLNRSLRLTDIARAVALSEGRLRHVFVRETGIPLTTYVLWSRMKIALRGLVRNHMTLAQAAHHAGYADHAHFTRTFRRMFGVSPSILRQQSQFIYVFDEP